MPCVSNRHSLGRPVSQNCFGRPMMMAEVAIGNHQLAKMRSTQEVFALAEQQIDQKRAPRSWVSGDCRHTQSVSSVVVPWQRQPQASRWLGASLSRHRCNVQHSCARKHERPNHHCINSTIYSCLCDCGLLSSGQVARSPLCHCRCIGMWPLEQQERDRRRLCLGSSTWR